MRNEKGQFIKGSPGFLGRHSVETKKKIQEARKRQGSNVWNKGTHFSSQLGKPRPLEVRRKIGNAQIAEKNHNWKGGISPLRGRIWKSVEYREWRSQIFSRDNFTCRICGIVGGKLNVDHYPIAFSVLVKKYAIKTLIAARDCNELWDTSNGRTLCYDCHLKTDSYGGRANRK